MIKKIFLLQNISSNCPNFIVTQSPMPSTYADFWTMVLEYQVEIVVCLLNDMEVMAFSIHIFKKTIFI